MKARSLTQHFSTDAIFKAPLLHYHCYLLCKGLNSISGMLSKYSGTLFLKAALNNQLVILLWLQVTKLRSKELMHIEGHKVPYSQFECCGTILSSGL